MTSSCSLGLPLWVIIGGGVAVVVVVLFLLGR